MKQIIGFFITRDIAVTSQNKVRSCSGHILDYLLQYQNTINCFYHLSYNVACILRQLNLTSQQLHTLHESGEVFIEPNYTIYYLHNKYFAIKRGFEWESPYVQFCDISQYIPWRIEDNYSEEYALQKARETQVIGQLVYNGLTKLDLTPDNLTSPIRVFEKGYFNRLDLPTVDDIPEEAGKVAYECCHGGWLECFKKGHFQAYDYDVSSSYPYQLSLLKELRYGKWQQNSLYQSSADYGFMSGEVTIQSHFSPVLYAAEDMLYTSVGTWKTAITKQEYDVIYKYNLGTFEIENGWWWTPNEINKSLPLKHVVDRLYKHKQTSEGLDKEVVKRIMSGMWGKLLEIKGDSFGDHFNPVWGAIVETNARLQVFEACMQSNIIPLSVAVDGVLTDRPMNVVTGNGLGSWELTSQCPVLVISSGIVAVKDKEHNHDFSLDYDWLLKEMQQYPHKATYAMSKPSPISLDKSFNYNDLSRLGTVEIITRTIDVEYEAKRCYVDFPATGGDLLKNKYESVAWDISFLKAAPEIKEG